MDSTKYIGIDVHKEASPIAVINAAGELVMGSIVETKAARSKPIIRRCPNLGRFGNGRSLSCVRRCAIVPCLISRRRSRARSE
jgi:hypothetical protein